MHRLAAVLVFSIILNAPAAEVWRQERKPLTHAGIEHLARDTGYIGAQSDEYNMRGEADLRNHLALNGFKLIDFVNDKSTGMQAILLADECDKSRVYAVFRGTEAHRLFEKEGWRDVAADAEGRIGKSQYDGAKEKLDEWAKKYDGRIVATGHSLGGALTQQFVADHPDAVKEAVTFNSPGVDQSTVEKVAGQSLPLTHYVVRGDAVSDYGGQAHLPGRIVEVTGEDVEGLLDAHRNFVLQPDSQVTRKEMGYAEWQAERVARDEKMLGEKREATTPDLAAEPEMPEWKSRDLSTDVQGQLTDGIQEKQHEQSKLDLDLISTHQETSRKEGAAAAAVDEAEALVDQAGQSARRVQEAASSEAAAGQTKEAWGEILSGAVEQGVQQGAETTAGATSEAVAEKAGGSIFGEKKGSGKAGVKTSAQPPPATGAGAVTPTVSGSIQGSGQAGATAGGAGGTSETEKGPESEPERQAPVGEFIQCQGCGFMVPAGKVPEVCPGCGKPWNKS